MPGKYSITLDLNILPMQQDGCRVPTEAEEECEKQWGEMTVQGIITQQVEPISWVSSHKYPSKADGTLRICLVPKDINSTIIHKHHKGLTLEEITQGLEVQLHIPN